MPAHRSVRRALTALLPLTLAVWGLPPLAPTQAAAVEPATTLLSAHGRLQVVGSFSRTAEAVPDRYSFEDEADFDVNYISSDSGQVSFDGVHMSSSASQSTTLLYDGERFTGFLSRGTLTARGLGTGAGTVQTTGGATAGTELDLRIQVDEPTPWRLVATSTTTRQQTRASEEVCRTATLSIVADDVRISPDTTCEDGQAEFAVDETFVLPAGETSVSLSHTVAALARSVSNDSGLSNGSWEVSFREVARGDDDGDDDEDLENLEPPLVGGVARSGRTLRASPGSWAGEPTAFAFRWLRDGRPIPGATGRTYAVQPADAGRALRVRVSASRAGADPVAALSAARAVARQVFSVRRPQIRGTARPGRTVTATQGVWSVRPTALAFRWLRNGRPIRAADGRTYRVRAADRGQRLAVRVTAQRPGHLSGSVTSSRRVG